MSVFRSAVETATDGSPATLVQVYLPDIEKVLDSAIYLNFIDPQKATSNEGTQALVNNACDAIMENLDYFVMSIADFVLMFQGGFSQNDLYKLTNGLADLILSDFYGSVLDDRLVPKPVLTNQFTEVLMPYVYTTAIELYGAIANVLPDGVSQGRLRAINATAVGPSTLWLLTLRAF